MATPQAAEAQVLTWDLACSTVGQPVGGGTTDFATCLSAQLSLVSGSTYDLILWNRAGENGTDPDGTITAVGIGGTTATASNLLVAQVGSAQGANDYLGWSVTNNIQGPSGAGGFTISGVNNGIVSEAWTGGALQNREQTIWNDILGFAGGGFVNFRFTTSAALDLTIPTPITLDLHVQNLGPNNDGSTGYSCPPTAPNSPCGPGGGGGTGNVVPEPSTYVLLGSGLLGIFGLAAHRRRRQA